MQMWCEGRSVTHVQQRSLISIVFGFLWTVVFLLLAESANMRRLDTFHLPKVSIVG
jgi:hypothetical protein